MNKVSHLVKELIEGNRRAIAKAITIMEDDGAESRELLSQIYPHTGRAHIIGFTGPGGSGKSTLIEKLAKEFRKNGKKVGIIAVDPSSPFTGGAFLGDRIRMQELSIDEDVFIRSMATRNNPGGLAKATKNAVAVLDASGKDVIIVETVGAGQSEVDIIKVAQTIVVVFAPGLGDEIQAIKAGIMEIADIFVVNKADRENADKAVIDIQAILELNITKKEWVPPVLKTSALSGEGISELLNKINEHGAYLKTQVSDVQRRKIAEAELIEAIKERATQKIVAMLKETGEFDELVNKILTRKVDPYSIAEKVFREKIKHLMLSP